MTRERLAWGLVVLALLLGGWWLSVNTEWVDDTRPRAMRGEALRNPVYAAEQMLRKLGLRASHHESLQRLPPPGARLVLLSADWRLQPDLSERLEEFRGAHPHLNVRGALLFSCACRGTTLYGEPGQDSALFAEGMGKLPLGGFFGNGFGLFEFLLGQHVVGNVLGYAVHVGRLAVFVLDH